MPCRVPGKPRGALQNAQIPAEWRLGFISNLFSALSYALIVFHFQIWVPDNYQ
jgi:hypothetical protein